MAIKRKRLLVDMVGYASLIPLFMLYEALKRACEDMRAVVLTVIVFLPIAVVWQHYYAKYSGEAEPGPGR
jgi:hypothetical protein